VYIIIYTCSFTGWWLIIHAVKEVKPHRIARNEGPEGDYEIYPYPIITPTTAHI
jgi:hypothetical protein